MSRKNDSTQNKKRLKWEKPCLMKFEKPATKGDEICSSGSGNINCVAGIIAAFCILGNDEPI